MSKRRPPARARVPRLQRRQLTALGIGAAVFVGLAILYALLRQSAAPPALVTSLATPQSWPRLLSDAFDEPAYAWQVGQFDDASAGGRLSVRGGKYLWEVQAHNSLVWWSLPDSSQSVGDFYAAVEARQISGTVNADLGLVFHWADEDYYYFQISPATQKFALNLYANGAWTPLVDWTASAEVKPVGEVNQLAVTTEGTQITLYLNGQRVGQAANARVPQGAVGVAAQLYYGDEAATFDFDNFEWRAPALTSP